MIILTKHYKLKYKALNNRFKAAIITNYVIDDEIYQKMLGTCIDSY